MFDILFVLVTHILVVLLLIATRVSCFESCWPPTLQQEPPLTDTCPGSLGFHLGRRVAPLSSQYAFL